MKVIIINNTALRGKSIAADPKKVISLKDEDARALISAGKAVRAPESKPAEKTD